MFLDVVEDRRYLTPYRLAGMGAGGALTCLQRDARHQSQLGQSLERLRIECGAHLVLHTLGQDQGPLVFMTTNYVVSAASANRVDNGGSKRLALNSSGCLRESRMGSSAPHLLNRGAWWAATQRGTT